MKKLNLHRKKHDTVSSEVIHFIEDNWDSGEEVEIITGNSAIMKKIVTDVLDEYGLTHQIGRPFDANNQGYIVTWL